MQGEEGEQITTDNQTKKILTDWLETHHAELLTALLPYAAMLQKTLGDSSMEIASELLVEVTRRAFVKATDYDPSRAPKAWLLGIAINTMREWQDRGIKWRLRYKNGPSGSGENNEALEDHLERIFAVGTGMEANVIGKFWADDMLRQAPKPHREIIKTFIETDFDSEATAAALGITNVNMRQRLNRARKWFKENMDSTQATLTYGGRQ